VIPTRRCKRTDLPCFPRNLLDRAHPSGFDHQQTKTIMKRIAHPRTCRPKDRPAWAGRRVGVRRTMRSTTFLSVCEKAASSGRSLVGICGDIYQNPWVALRTNLGCQRSEIRNAEAQKLTLLDQPHIESRTRFRECLE
jgi:hypothetical protein